MIEKEVKEYCLKTGQSEQEVYQRLEKGEPLQYILGEWEFYGLPFKVGKGVLIPQPDTEIVVEKALEVINSDSRVLDLCSGSGCIAVAINKMSKAKVVAVEKYSEAIDYLKKNVELNSAEVEIVQADVLKPPQLKGQFDVVVANPPYISHSERQLLSKDVLNQPHTALFAENDGLEFYIALKKWLDLLRPGGRFFFEIGYSQAEKVQEIYKQYSPLVYKDYGSNDRVISGTKPVI